MLAPSVLLVLFVLPIAALPPAVAGPRQDEPPALQPGEMRVLEVGPEGVFLEYHSASAETLHAWTGPREIRGRVMLRFLDGAANVLAEDDGESGERLPRASVDVEADSVVLVEIALAEGAEVCVVELHVATSAESESTRVAARRADEELSAIGVLTGQAKHDEARERTEQLIAGIAAVDGIDRSALLADACVRAGRLADELGALAAAIRANEWARAHHDRVSPPDTFDWRWARLELATVLDSAGQVEQAYAILVETVHVLAAHLPPDHVDLLRARVNFAGALRDLGRSEEARALFAEVLEVAVRTLPADDVLIDKARMNLAVVMHDLGQVELAREMHELVLESRKRTLAPDDPRLQLIRLNLGSTLAAVGDLDRARELLEGGIEALSSTYPDEHPQLLMLRANLAIVRKHQGDVAGAREIEEEILVTALRVLPEESLELQGFRHNLACSLLGLGEAEAARALFQIELDRLERALPATHPDVPRARYGLAMALYAGGDREGAVRALAQIVEQCSRAFPEEPFVGMAARSLLAFARAREGDDAAGRALAEALARSCSRTLKRATLASSPRESAARSASYLGHASAVLSHGAGSGGLESSPSLESAAFLLVETLRSAELLGPWISRLAAEDPELDVLRSACATTAAELARVIRSGIAGDVLRDALAERERAWDLYVERLGQDEQAAAVLVEPTPERLARAVPDRGALIGYWVYDRHRLADEDTVLDGTSEASLLAWVLRPGAALVRVELGPLAPIVAAASSWRDELRAARPRGERAAGERLRALVLDPLRAHLAGAERLIVAAAGPLHAVPIDALPLDGEGDRRLGDELAIEVRATLWEMLAPEREHGGASALVALGGIDYDRPGERLALEASTAPGNDLGALPARTRGGAAASVLREGGWEQGFGSLPRSADEVRAVASHFAGTFGGESGVHLLMGREASREALVALAARARFLHLATHGWISGEAVLSSSDAASSIGPTAGAQDDELRVRGLAPMLLCGLALAGANDDPDPILGCLPGVLTAEEVATLDLAGCELAVLSACQTSLGVARAGLGLASLQRALQMAGAQSTITSLWAVPDEATHDLMVEFYRRYWIEGEPRSRALWAAKQKLRGARDDLGRPRHSPVAWAGWVLTGDPD